MDVSLKELLSSVIVLGEGQYCPKPINHGQFKTCELRPEDSKPSPKKRRDRFAKKTSKKS